MATQDNLKDAFAGESQANRKYLAYAKKADADGFGQVAKLFRAAADAETVHAHAHLRAMGGIEDTAANLADAIAGEGHEFKEMYPGFVAEAEAEGDRAALVSFENAIPPFGNCRERRVGSPIQVVFVRVDSLHAQPALLCVA